MSEPFFTAFNEHAVPYLAELLGRQVNDFGVAMTDEDNNLLATSNISTHQALIYINKVKQRELDEIKAAKKAEKAAKLTKANAENKARNEEFQRLKKDSRVTVMENNNLSETERKLQIEAADAKRTADKAKELAEARLQRHEANKNKKEMEALANGKKPKTRWNKTDINENI
jgi:multidrug efflux pump subunit AcrA (membrane-fusion protein)